MKNQVDFVNIVNVKKLKCPRCSFDLATNSMDFELNQNTTNQNVRCPVCNEKWQIIKDNVFGVINEETAVSVGYEIK